MTKFLGKEFYVDSSSRFVDKVNFDTSVNFNEYITSDVSIMGKLTIESGGLNVTGDSILNNDLDVSGDVSAGNKIYATGNFRYNDGNKSIAIGDASAGSNEGLWYVALGYNAGFNAGQIYVAIGEDAGSNSGNFFTAVGRDAGNTSGADFVAVGRVSGFNSGDSFTALGSNAGGQAGSYFSAIGNEAGLNAGDNFISAGYKAGKDASDNFIAIGYKSADADSNTASDLSNFVTIGYNSRPQRSGHFVLQQYNINPVPLIQGDFSTGDVSINNILRSNEFNVDLSTHRIYADASNMYFEDPSTGSTSLYDLVQGTAIENKFVNESGDTMTGKLTISSGGLSVVGDTSLNNNLLTYADVSLYGTNAATYDPTNLPTIDSSAQLVYKGYVDAQIQPQVDAWNGLTKSADNSVGLGGTLYDYTYVDTSAYGIWFGNIANWDSYIEVREDKFEYVGSNNIKFQMGNYSIGTAIATIGHAETGNRGEQIQIFRGDRIHIYNYPNIGTDSRHSQIELFEDYIVFNQESSTGLSSRVYLRDGQLEYSVDYSTNYIDRTLPDWGNVKSHVDSEIQSNRYTDSFDGTSGTSYTVLASTHGLGVGPFNISVYDSSVLAYTDVSLNTTGDITIKWAPGALTSYCTMIAIV